MTRLLRWLTLCLSSLLLLPSLSYGLDPTLQISQYRHIAWRLQDGLFRGTPQAIGQTKDGYLWIGTNAGLVRFDGIRFFEYPSGPARVVSLLGASDGTLWIGTGLSLFELRQGRFIAHPEVSGRINDIREDARGSIWFTRSRMTEPAPLCVISKGVTRCFGHKEGVPFDYAESLEPDGSGGFWVSGIGTLLHWSETSHELVTPPGLRGSANNGIEALLRRADGSLLLGMTRSGRGLGLQTLNHGVLQVANVPGERAEAIEVASLLQDKNGTLWIGSEDDGLLHVHDGRTDHFRSTDGLSSNTVTCTFQDQEGSVWVATSKGLDQFSALRVVPLSAREGLSQDLVASVAASHHGGIWIGNMGSLSLLRNGALKTVSKADGLPGLSVTSMLEDHAGVLWVGIDHALFRYESGLFTEVRRADGSTSGMLISLAEDTEHRVWAVSSGKPYTLLRAEGEPTRLTPVPLADNASPVSIAADPASGIVIAEDLGPSGYAFFQHRGARATLLTRFEARAFPENFLLQSDGTLWSASRVGILFHRKDQSHILTASDGLPCARAYSIAEDREGNLWITAPCGIYELSRDAIRAFEQDPTRRFAPRLLDVFDGALTAATDYSARSTQSRDGRVWFVNNNIAMFVNPDQARQNTLAPPVHIEEIIADHRAVPLMDPLALPPLTKDVEIHYTALSFVAPQKIAFRYKLEGHDDAWQIVGSRRAAFYNDLPPGHYRFHVAAANGDGMWNEVGDSLAFSIRPAWYQTTWLRLCAVLVLVALAITVYRLRVRTVRREVAMRYDERLAERVRLARDIHDTLLQTLQGSKMVVDDALDTHDDPEKPHRTLRKLSIWLGQAMDEGRAALHSLRSSASETNNLAGSFRELLDECRGNGFPETQFSVVGVVAAMHPIVRDEIYCIGAEAIRNASMHSGGTLIEVALTYGKRLVLRVKDNGVGIPAPVARSGRSGHFGILGMRERAARIRARIEIHSVDGGGSEVLLSVPGQVIFQARRSSWRSRFKRFLDDQRSV